MEKKKLDGAVSVADAVYGLTGSQADRLAVF